MVDEYLDSVIKNLRTFVELEKKTEEELKTYKEALAIVRDQRDRLMSCMTKRLSKEAVREVADEIEYEDKFHDRERDGYARAVELLFNWYMSAVEMSDKIVKEDRKLSAS